MKRTFITALAAMMLCIPATAENSPASDAAGLSAEKKETKKKKEVTYNEKGEIIKTGLNLGPLPVVAFDADRGFQFGALLNLYQFGDGSTYPNPKSQWYIEASAYTKESSINRSSAKSGKGTFSLLASMARSRSVGITSW